MMSSSQSQMPEGGPSSNRPPSDPGAYTGRQALGWALASPLATLFVVGYLAKLLGLQAAIAVSLAAPAVALYYAYRTFAQDHPSQGRVKAAIGASTVGLWLIAMFWLIDLLGRPSSSCGRPFRVGGRRRQAEPQPGAGWQPSEPAPDEAILFTALREQVAQLPPSTRDDLAQVWLRDAAEEHASIAAFAQLSLDLLALGAPPQLLTACHQAAQDEVGHATRCYQLASLYADTPLSPQPLPEAGQRGRGHEPRAQLLLRLAEESLRDGSLNEGWAAELAQRGAATAHPAIAQVLSRIAQDERRHAELGWQVLSYCLAEGGAEVAARVSQVLTSLPSQVSLRDRRPKRGQPEELAYRQAGRLLPDEVLAAYRSTLASVQQRGQALLSAACAQPAQCAA